MKKVLILFVLLLTGCTQQSTSIPTQQDTNWTSGQLDNGLRYHIYPLDTEAISLRLFVHAGSLEETPDQLGYAHFVEHMAFNGSENFTPNEVIELMEKTGASGHDVNAYTSYEETVYTLSLPNQDELDKAMLWLRDVANRVTFAPDEVEREKGVVLAEYRVVFLNICLSTIKYTKTAWKGRFMKEKTRLVRLRLSKMRHLNHLKRFMILGISLNQVN